ncbi:hypothetical protein Q9233_008846 [Columba guinea]|nr:hypothetical protein Q9233_008846 [Columba guinea]
MSPWRGAHWVQRRVRSPEASGWPAGTNGTRVTLMGEEEEDAAAQVAVVTIVPVFCAMGLLGILVCNLLKKRGYHCTTSKEHPPGGTGPSSIYQLEDANEDTIGVLVRLITEKKENAAALEELLKEHHKQQLMSPGCSPPNKLHLLPQFPLSCWHQQHLHTVQGPAPCARCSQRWPELLPPFSDTKVPKPGGCPSEVTILSIGRLWRSSSDQPLDLEKLFRPNLGSGDTLQTNPGTWRSSSDQPLDLKKLFRPTFGLEKLFRPTLGPGEALQTNPWAWRSSSDQALDLQKLFRPALGHLLASFTSHPAHLLPQPCKEGTSLSCSPGTWPMGSISCSQEVQDATRASLHCSLPITQDPFAQLQTQTKDPMATSPPTS